jgi:hypothetical protein
MYEVPGPSVLRRVAFLGYRSLVSYYLWWLNCNIRAEYSLSPPPGYRVPPE